MTAWLALATALSTALSRIVEFFLKREERARETVTPPSKPTTVEEYQRRKLDEQRKQSGS